MDATNKKFMIYNDVDIYSCKFFTLNKDKKLQFAGGVNKGKTADDFNSPPELQKVMAYCFWIFRKPDIPWNSKFAATAFMRQLMPKFIKLEELTKKAAIRHENKMKKEVEDAIKTPGTKYV